MKILIFLNLLFISSLAQADNSNVLEFASSIKHAVKSNSIQKLKELKCYPVQNHCVTEAAIEYIFGKNKSGSIGTLISNKSTKIKVYGPATYEPKHPNSSYVIVFYNPAVIKFMKNGLLSEKIEKEQWNINLAETVVTIINGEVHFNRTIFYYGTHAPWAGEYG